MRKKVLVLVLALVLAVSCFACAGDQGKTPENKVPESPDTFEGIASSNFAYVVKGQTLGAGVELWTVPEEEEVKFTGTAPFKEYNGRNALDLDYKNHMDIRFQALPFFASNFAVSNSISFSTWVYLRGDWTDGTETAHSGREYNWQRLMCVSGVAGYYCLTPYGNDDTNDWFVEKNEAGEIVKHLDGSLLAGGVYGADDNCFAPIETNKENTAPKLNTWAHMAFTITPNKLAIYINGEPYASIEGSGVEPSLLAVDLARIGSTFWERSFLNAAISDTLIYDIELSAAQIKTVYNASKIK